MTYIMQINFRFKSLSMLLIALVYLALVLPTPAMAQNGALDNVPDKPSFIFDLSLNMAFARPNIGSEKFSDYNAIRNFYKARDNAPYWMDNNGLNKNGLILFNALETAWTHGLNPEKYHAAKLNALRAQPNFLRNAQMELLLTDGFMRYASDLSGMRVTNVDSMQTSAEYWRQRTPAVEALAHLRSDKSFSDILAEVEPQSVTYQKLRAELIALNQQTQRTDYDHVLPIEIDYMIRPGERHPKIPDLRVRLGTEQQTKDALRYDDRMVAAVMRFQRENNLEDDGIVGTRTLQLLNRTLLDKKYQLIANMERLRWAPVDRPARFIAVNIPSAKLWGIKNDKVAVEMPIIVGSPVRKTRSFVTHVEGVRFNPDWTIPATIKRFDIWPKVREDVNYLEDKGIVLLKGYGVNARRIDPHSINWNTVSWSELQQIRMVQEPGENNPLGRVRVLMPNVYNIYLHDTNHPEYFERNERALSSGCMRMKEPEKVAKFIMESRAGWGSGDMYAALGSGKKTDISVEERMPVYVYYYTNWIDSSGKVVFGSDVYRNDAKLIKLLAESGELYLPGLIQKGPEKTPVLATLASAE